MRGLLAALLAGLLAAGAHAACAPLPGPEVATAPAMQPYVDRFNALLAADPYLVLHETAPGFTGPGWRALVADLRRDPTAPPALVARAETMLAGAVHEEGAKEGRDAALAARARAEANGLGATPLHALILTALSEREADVGDGPAALRDADAALAETARAFGPESWAGGAALAALGAYNNLGRYAEAERFADEAERLALTCLAPDNSLVAETAADHGSMYGMTGQIEDSLAAYERAIAWIVAHHHEDSDLYPFVLRNYGFTLRNAGRLREAEAVMRRGVDLDARFRPGDWGHRADGLGKFANLLAAEGKWPEAEAMWLRARAAQGRSGDLNNPLVGSGELRRAADAAEERGDLAHALTLRQQAIALVGPRVRADHPELARMRIEYAATLLIAGRSGAALAIARPAVALVRAQMPEGDFKRLGIEITYARIVGAAGDPAAGYAIAAPVAARLARLLLDSATARGDLVRFSGIFATSFATVAALALETGRQEEALHALQLANLSDIVLVNAAVAARAAATDPAAQALVLRLDGDVRRRQQLDRDRVLAAGQHDSAAVLRLDAAVGASDAAIGADGRALDAAFPAYAALRRPEPAALPAVRARLGPGEALIAPLVLPERVVTLVLTRDRLAWAAAPVTRARLVALVGRIRAAVDRGRSEPAARFDADAAYQLGQALLPPALASTLAAQPHLRFYASGALATLPPALLVTAPPRRDAPPAWLIRDHSLAVVTSLGGPVPAAAAPATAFLGIGAPALAGRPLVLASRGGAVPLVDFGAPGAAALPPLPGAARELRAMAATFAPADRTLLLGPGATEAVVKALPLRRYGVIAVATHGLLADALPGLTQPALVLTPPPRARADDDGLLTAGEIAGLRLDADWVILSACDSAGGSDPQSASYGGLASAFVQAGARALLVSQWPVRDDAAGRLTVATLAATRRGVDRATALQQATLALMRDRAVPNAAHPAVWAPFVLVEP